MRGYVRKPRGHRREEATRTDAHAAVSAEQRRPADVVRHLQRTVGNAAVLRLKQALTEEQHARVVQRDAQDVSIRSPVFEETVTQVSDVLASATGRPLNSAEQTLAEGVFGRSLDYGRVRLIPTSILEYRTVANTIRVPEDFTIENAEMAETLIHELTHVWQYQHGGTAYISTSLSTQIVASITSGSRNAAYDYEIEPDSTFFDFLPEQQGLLVQNYFAMVRDQAAPADARTYRSNHMDSNGDFIGLTWQQRQAEITRELPLHRPLIAQMEEALPNAEADILTMRAQEVIQMPGQGMFPVSEQQEMLPVRPLLEIRF